MFGLLGNLLESLLNLLFTDSGDLEDVVVEVLLRGEGHHAALGATEARITFRLRMQ